MTTPTIVTCGDLAALAGPWSHLWRHDPEHMVAGEDALCHCYGRCPPQDTDPVACRALLPVPLTEDLTLKVCCLCTSYFADALRSGEPERLHRWLLRQVDEALAFRDRRRMDGPRSGGARTRRPIESRGGSMSETKFTRGDLVRHRASGELAVVTLVGVHCTAHKDHVFGEALDGTPCTLEPTGHYDLDLGFDRPIVTAAEHLLEKVETEEERC